MIYNIKRFFACQGHFWGIWAGICPKLQNLTNFMLQSNALHSCKNLLIMNFFLQKSALFLCGEMCYNRRANHRKGSLYNMRSPLPATTPVTTTGRCSPSTCARRATRWSIAAARARKAAIIPFSGRKAAQMVKSGECERGVLVCGTGFGISLAANRSAASAASTAQTCSPRR